MDMQRNSIGEPQIMSWVEVATLNNMHHTDTKERQDWLGGLMVGDLVARTVQLTAISQRGWGKAHLYGKTFELHMTVTKVLKTQIVCDNKHRYVKTGCSCGFGYGDTRGAIHPAKSPDERDQYNEYYETLNSYMNRLHLLNKAEFTAPNFQTIESLKEAVHEMEGHQVRMRAIVMKGSK
ncbi:hypothetical protein VH22019_00043 [Vibrio phage VH2_2019]|nr:hypothetical protein VH22019_00043 [Vibrio phage VH2_2019]